MINVISAIENIAMILNILIIWIGTWRRLKISQIISTNIRDSDMVFRSLAIRVFSLLAKCGGEIIFLVFLKSLDLIIIWI